MKEERKVIQIKIDDILPNRFQPRIRFDEEAITELSTSIKEHGVIQPIVVRTIGDKYEIIAGERRYKASVMAGLDSIPAVITNLNDKDSAEVALIENVQRQDLTPIEEAISYKKILDMGYLTQDKLAAKLGKSQSAVANKLRLLNLEDDVQEAVLNENISERHARSLLRIENPDKQIEMLNRIINERLTVRKTDEEIDKMIDGNNNEEKTMNDMSIFQMNNDDINDKVIEPETPVDFKFDIKEEQPKENLFDISEPSDESSNFFGFNQNVINDKEESDATDNNFNFNFNSFLEEKDNEATPTVDEYTIDNDSTTNPSFMNLNKIETEAQDIYQEKPQSDINSLLEPTLLVNNDNEEEQPIINPPVEEEIKPEEQPEETFKPGKFFNIFKKQTEDNEYNSNFEEKPEEAPVDNNNTPMNADFGELFNQDTTNDEIPFTVTQNNEEEQPEKYEFNEFVPQSLEMNSEETPVDLAPTMNSEFNVDEAQDIMNSIESIEKSNNNFNDNLNTDVEVDTVASKNVMSVVTKIRDLIASIEKEGFMIDTEEMDFENSYQINIKIDK